MKTFKILPVAALGIALSMGATQKAEAYAYANADLAITNGLVTVIPINTTAITGFGTALADGSASFGGTSPTSKSEASLSTTPGVSNTNPTNAAISVANGSSFPDGTAPGEDSYTFEGASNSHIYAWGDSVVNSEQSITGVNGDGSPNVGSYVATQQAVEGNTFNDVLASSGARTSSSSTITTKVTISGNDGARIRFDFDAALELAIAITAPDTGVLALADSTVTIEIKNSAGATVAIWTIGQAAFGGFATTVNPFDVSQGMTITETGSNSFDSLGAASFWGVTNNLGADTYTILFLANLEQSVQAVPSPGTLALLGSGLFILGLGRRRKGLAA